MLNRFFRSAKKSEIIDIIDVNDSVLVALSSLPQGFYNSSIVDIEPDCIHLSLPSKDGMRLPLHKKAKLLVSVMTKKGRINFISRVEDFVSGNVKTVKIAMPSEFRAEQLRKYFRVPVNNMKVKIVTAHDSFPASVTNLSGGGCLLHTQSREFKVGEKVKLDFSSTNLGIWDVGAKIVRMNISGVAFQFIIKEIEREKIVRYVLRRQLDSAV